MNKITFTSSQKGLFDSFLQILGSAARTAHAAVCSREEEERRMSLVREPCDLRGEWREGDESVSYFSPLAVVTAHHLYSQIRQNPPKQRHWRFCICIPLQRITRKKWLKCLLQSNSHLWYPVQQNTRMITKFSYISGPLKSIRRPLSHIVRYQTNSSLWQKSSSTGTWFFFHEESI